jgi:hypothetical protein
MRWHRTPATPQHFQRPLRCTLGARTHGPRGRPLFSDARQSFVQRRRWAGQAPKRVTQQPRTPRTLPSAGAAEAGLRPGRRRASSCRRLRRPSGTGRPRARRDFYRRRPGKWARKVTLHFAEGPSPPAPGSRLAVSPRAFLPPARQRRSGVELVGKAGHASCAPHCAWRHGCICLSLSCADLRARPARIVRRVVDCALRRAVSAGRRLHALRARCRGRGTPSPLRATNLSRLRTKFPPLGIVASMAPAPDGHLTAKRRTTLGDKTNWETGNRNKVRERKSNYRALTSEKSLVKSVERQATSLTRRRLKSA